MQTPPSTSLLAVFIAMGVALECEECSVFGNSCAGRKKPCSQGQDTCSVSVTSINLTLNGRIAFTKGCISSKLCDKGPLIFNMGASQTTITESACCVGDACNTTRPLMPRRNTTLNGRQCLACPPDGARCKIIECAGEETKCFEVSGTTALAAQTVNNVLKGCASELACEALETGHLLPLGMIQPTKSARCKNGAASATSGSLGLLLQALSGLLLVKFLA